MSQLPSKFMLAMPGILHYVGALAVLLGLGAQANPDMAGGIGISAAIAGLLVSYGGKLFSEFNQKKTAEAKVESDKSLPPPPAGVSPLTHGICITMGQAAASGCHEAIQPLSQALIASAPKGAS